MVISLNGGNPGDFAEVEKMHDEQCHNWPDAVFFCVLVISFFGTISWILWLKLKR